MKELALLLGVVVALLQAIPLVGAVISGPIVLLVVLATSGWTKMLIVTAIFGVMQIVDQNLISPIIFGTRLQLSFLLIIFSTVTGGLLLGIGGAFLAVPAAAVLQVIVVQIIAPAIRRANQIAPTPTPAPKARPYGEVIAARRALSAANSSTASGVRSARAPDRRAATGRNRS